MLIDLCQLRLNGRCSFLTRLEKKNENENKEKEEKMKKTNSMQRLTAEENKEKNKEKLKKTKFDERLLIDLWQLKLIGSSFLVL